EPLVIEIWLNVVRIVEQHAAVAQETDVVLVTVLVKRDQKIGFIACRQHFTGTDAYLENGRTTRNRRGDGHVGHDVVLAASGKAREKGAGGLNSVLRISREPDHRVLNAFRPQIGPARQEEFVGKVVEQISGTMTTLLGAVGDRLGLFKNLAQQGPATSAELASRTNLNERYVREWLGGMAAAGYLNYDGPTKRFN